MSRLLLEKLTRGGSISQASQPSYPDLSPGGPRATGLRQNLSQATFFSSACWKTERKYTQNLGKAAKGQAPSHPRDS